MKKILLLIIFVLGIQVLDAQNKYDKLWKEVEKLELEGKFKSANEIVNKVLNKAKRSNESSQIVKGFIYKSKFALLLKEDAQKSIISELETSIKEFDFPTNAILESVYAGYLQQYLQKNRYTIRKRTKTDFTIESNDFEKWDINTLVAQIARHYELSIKEQDKLKQLSIKGFKAILTDSKTSHKFRPTLYDFLVHRALQFYESGKWYVKRPKERFYINNPIVFEPTEQFKEEHFYTTDSLYSNRNVLKLYQKLETFHKISDTVAYVDVVLNRLKFSRKYATIEHKDTLYLKALYRFSEKLKNHEVSSVIDYHIAAFYFESSKRANAKKDPVLRNYRIKALAVCDNVLNKFPNSDGGLLCTILKNNIEEQSVTIQSEEFIIPEKPFLAKVTFKSVDSLYLSAYKIPNGYFENIYSYKRDSLALEVIKKNEPIQSRFYKLQPKKDFYKYSTEIDLPKLPMGRYFIVASNKKEIESINQIYSYDVIIASNLSMISINKNNSLAIKILDRNNGSPIKDVALSITSSKGFIQKGKTNTQGEFNIKKGKDYRNNLKIIASHKGDTLANDRLYLYRSYNDAEENDERIAKMFLYLDRSIYRPGQTIYFKGILVENKKGKSKVVPNIYTYIAIYDTNDEELKEFRLKTNEFGSVSGEFKIPTNVLTGEFYIEMDEDYGTDDEDEDAYYEKIDDLEYSEVYFSVEEYKRPKFEVTFDDVVDNYKVEDSVKVSGLAKSFFGATISDAKVTYSISRETLPNWGRNYYASSSQIMKTGKTQTDDKGKFYIDFRAVPDSLSNKKDKPIFIYSIKADITDINGETRSASKTVKVGYHNLKVNVLIGNKLNASESQQLQVSAKNLNDQPIQADRELSIYKLSSPKRVLRKKPWEVVELPTIPKNRYIELFPNEVYDSTDVKKNWNKGNLVFSKNLNAVDADNIELDNISNWESGLYVLEAKAIDVFKDTVSVTKQFEIYHPKDNFLSDYKLFEYEITNSDFKNDQYIGIKLKTGARNLNVTLEGYYKGKSVFNQIVTIQNGSTIVKIPVSKNYKNKLDFNLYFVKFNSLHSDQFSVNFPEAEKELIIETISFRNKLVPDQKETWSFKITNSDNKNAEAEVLASMYDASLDQFKEHSWSTNIGFEKYGYSYAPSIQSNGSFNTSIFYDFNRQQQNNINSFIKNYHKLKWFGFNFGTIGYENKAYLNTLSTKLKNPQYVEGNINGIIVDNSGLPLPGVNVIVKGTTTGSQTDFDGLYSINASVGSVLVFSYVGFKTAETSITKSGTVNIVMEEDASMLDEVVVTAQGIKRELKALGYAISYVNAEDVSNDIARKLSGRISGVQITSQSGASGATTNIIIRGNTSINGSSKPLFIVDGIPMNLDESEINLSPSDIEEISVLKGLSATAIYGSRGRNGVVIITTKKGLEALTQVEARSNLKETAFFFPHLNTNKKGEVTFSFDSPQALTKWKFMLFAHNKTLEVGGLEKTAVTQKDINVIPNAPRFLRENDTIKLSAKISNLTKEQLSGTSLLQLFDAVTMKPIDKSVIPVKSAKNFTISPNGNTTISWALKIPEGLQALQYKIVAKSGTHTDGEANILPVLSNRTLITEARPLWIPSGKTKEVIFKKLKLPNSASLKNHKFTLEYTSNPTWLAIKSLPYLMEFPYECAEQTFSRLYANALAYDIISKKPQIEAVFKNWKNNGSIESPLEQNETLKSILISESPWVRDLLSDKENKSKLANLFDKEKLIEQELQTLSKLKELQLSSGGFPWFSGGRENTFITRHIVAGLGHLNKLNIQSENDYKIKPILKRAISYLDSEFVAQYQNDIRLSKDSTKISISNDIVHYLYSRSFFLDTYPLSDKTKKVIDVYLEKCKYTWITQSLYIKGMIALILHRFKEEKTAKMILEALSEQSIISEDNGMYWKENSKSWYWYKAPIETQALLIEAFAEIENDTKKIDQLKQWLLKNKQTNKWGSTKATTEAIYALLMHGSDWLSITDNTVITIGNEKIKTSKLTSTEKEAKTGYMKVNWKAEEISSEMASVKIKNKGNITGFGGVYWQYFEDLDKVTTSESTPLNIKKKMFIKKTTDEGEKLIPITSDTPIKLGDLITVRIEITSKNDMEFVHLKDLRASGLEPIDVLSEYKWQDGLGYYQSTKDVATHFFFDELLKGTYIFEYNLRANNSGNFSNGITTIQSMYAPEFASHSKGIRLQITD
jgi:TonB-dependent SusC/RagA subfamily outer membrane receptor